MRVENGIRIADDARSTTAGPGIPAHSRLEARVADLEKRLADLERGRTDESGDVESAEEGDAPAKRPTTRKVETK